MKAYFNQTPIKAIVFLIAISLGFFNNSPIFAKNEAHDLTKQAMAAIDKHSKMVPSDQAKNKGQLQKMLAERKKEMKKTLEQDVQGFLLAAMPAEYRNQLPKDLKSEVEEAVELEGSLLISVAENIQQSKFKVIYDLESSSPDKPLYHLHLTVKDKALKTGDKVELKGIKLDDDVAVDNSPVASASTPGTTSSDLNVVAAASYPLVSGEHKVLGITVNFQNKAFDTTNAVVHANLFTNFNSVKNFYAESSFNKVNITGDVVGPYTIAYDASTTTCDYYNWGNAARQAAMNAGVAVNNYAHVMYYFPYGTYCSTYASGQGQVGGSTTLAWIYGWNDRVEHITHELGHNLGMWHASTLSQEYGDGSDCMGGCWNTQSQQNAAHKHKMQWVPDGNVQNVIANGTYTISGAESSDSALRALKIPKLDTNEHYYISYRYASGVFDADLGAPYAPATNIHKWNGSGNTYYLSSLSDGTSFVDATNGVTVTQVSHDATSSTVSVQFTTPPCTQNNPLISISPLSRTAGPGVAAQYTVSVTNKNSTYCGTSNMQFSQTLPADFSGTFSPSSLNLSPGQSAAATWTVTSPAAAANSSNSITVNTFDINDPVHQALANATYVVFYDNIAPTVSITSPASGSTVGRKTTITASASDNAAVSKVEFHIDGKLMATDTSAPYSYAWNSLKAAKGAHTITAKAFDATNNNASATVTVNK